MNIYENEYNVQDYKKLSYCWDSSRYDCVSDSSRSTNTKCNCEVTSYDLCKFYFM